MIQRCGQLGYFKEFKTLGRDQGSLIELRCFFYSWSRLHKALQKDSQYIMPRMPLFLLKSYWNDLKQTIPLTSIQLLGGRGQRHPHSQKLTGSSLTWIVVKTREKGAWTRPRSIASEGKSFLREEKLLPMGTRQPSGVGGGRLRLEMRPLGSWNLATLPHWCSLEVTRCWISHWEHLAVVLEAYYLAQMGWWVRSLSTLAPIRTAV